MDNVYITGNKKLDASIALARKKQPQKNKTRMEMLVEAQEEARNDPIVNKYGVAPREERTYNDIVFDSKLEMEHYQELLLRVRGGEIEDLHLQVQFNLMQGFMHPQWGRVNAISYIADFVYKCLVGEYAGKTVVEDAKGMRTAHYIDKRKMFLKLYPTYIFLEV